jgi:hypothetical protein
VAKTAFDAFNALPGPVKQLALAAIVGNKVTGGALGSIAGGLKDIFSGSIKLAFQRGATPANPLFVAPVGGGLGGGVPAGGGGGGLIGGLKTGVALAAPVLAGIAAVEVVNFQNMRTEAIGGLESILDDMPRRTGAEIDESISRIESEIAKDRPFLEGILFNTNVRPVLEAELEELKQAEVANALNVVRGTEATTQAIATASARAASSDRAMLNTAITAEGIAYSQRRIAEEALAADRNLVAQAQRQQSTLDAISGRTSATADAVRQNTAVLASKNFDPKITVALTNNISNTVLVNKQVQLTSVVGTNTSKPSVF